MNPERLTYPADSPKILNRRRKNVQRAREYGCLSKPWWTLPGIPGSQTGKFRGGAECSTCKAGFSFLAL